jgi:hypothetical protein
MLLLLLLLLLTAPTAATGAAMVYLYEIADPRYKAVTGSLGYISLGAGVVLGILVVAAIISAIPECEYTALQ